MADLLQQVRNDIRSQFELTKQKHEQYGNIYDDLSKSQDYITSQRTISQQEEFNKNHLQSEEFSLVLQACEYNHNWLSFMWQPMAEMRRKLLSTIENGLKTAVGVANRLISETMPAWKREQQCTQIGFPATSEQQLLANIRQEFDELGNFIFDVKQYVSAFSTIVQMNERYIGTNDMATCVELSKSIEQQANDLLRMLVSHALVVSIEPRDPLKMKKLFTTEVTLMRCGQIPITIGPVTVDMLKEQSIPDVDIFNAPSVGEISNGKESLKMNAETGAAHATFSNRQIVRLASRRNRSAHSAAEQEYVLRFQVKNLQCWDIGTVDITMLSEPFTVPVHTNQEVLSYAVAFWKKAFGKPDGENKVVPLWDKFAQAIGYYFGKLLETDCLLNDTHLNSFGLKLLGRRPTPSDSIDFDFVAKRPLAVTANKFTFWQWFYESVQLIKKRLPILELWTRGWFAGYITKADAEALLKQANVPSFLFRFSDSQLAAFSLVVCYDGNTGVEHLAPFTNEHLQVISLCEAIDCKMMEGIDYLHNGVSKQEIFKVLNEKTNEENQQASKGYVKWNVFRTENINMKLSSQCDSFSLESQNN